MSDELPPDQQATNAEPLDAASVFVNPPEPPKVTESVVSQSAPATDSLPGSNGKEVTEATGPVDCNGVRFDPALHQVKKDGTPNTRRDGSYVPRGGRAKKPPKAAPDVSELAPAKPSADDIDMKTSEGERCDIETEPEISTAEAEATAQGVTSVTWTIAAATLGKEWEPTEVERKVWCDYWRRVALATGLRMPLVVEGLIHAVTSCGRRLKDADKESRWGKVVSWARGEE